jgi:hypothetical protein
MHICEFGFSVQTLIVHLSYAVWQPPNATPVDCMAEWRCIVDKFGMYIISSLGDGTNGKLR